MQNFYEEQACRKRLERKRKDKKGQERHAEKGVEKAAEEIDMMHLLRHAQFISDRLLFLGQHPQMGTAQPDPIGYQIPVSWLENVGTFLTFSNHASSVQIFQYFTMVEIGFNHF
jgi:hypothetical protein